jgi:hypothetical protein
MKSVTSAWRGGKTVSERYCSEARRYESKRIPPDTGEEVRSISGARRGLWGVGFRGSRRITCAAVTMHEGRQGKEYGYEGHHAP